MDEPHELFQSSGGTAWNRSEGVMDERLSCKKHYLCNELGMENPSGGTGLSSDVREWKRPKVERNSENGLAGSVKSDGAQENGGPNIIQETARPFLGVKGEGVNPDVEKIGIGSPGGGKQVQVGEFAAQILRNGGKFQAGNSEGGNQDAVLSHQGDADQSWNRESTVGNGGGVADAGQEEHVGMGRAHVCENDDVGPPAVCEDGNVGCLKELRSKEEGGHLKVSQKKRVLNVEEGPELLSGASNEEGDEIFSLWLKRGQSKSSKNKNKQRSGGETMELNVQTVDGDESADTHGKNNALSVEIIASDVGAGNLENHCQPEVLKSGKKLGRPKGSKNKIKSNLCAIDADAGDIKMPKRCDRPKESISGRKIIPCHRNSNSVDTKALKKRGRPKGSKNKMKSSASNVGVADIEAPEKRGRPKGAKKK